jgi:hypothetical protein
LPTFALFTDKDIKQIVEWVTPRQIAQWVEESTGEKIKIVEVDDEKWPSLKKGNEEMWRNMECSIPIKMSAISSSPRSCCQMR